MWGWKLFFNLILSIMLIVYEKNAKTIISITTRYYVDFVFFMYISIMVFIFFSSIYIFNGLKIRYLSKVL